jgi:hypothetical protein
MDRVMDPPTALLNSNRTPLILQKKIFSNFTPKPFINSFNELASSIKKKRISIISEFLNTVLQLTKKEKNYKIKP